MPDADFKLLTSLKRNCKEKSRYLEPVILANFTKYAALEDPSIDQRIINQYSFFSIIPSDMESVEDFLNQYTQQTVKYIISRDLKWQVRDLLDQLNMSERIVYPGLDGLSKWLVRHYYAGETNSK